MASGTRTIELSVVINGEKKVLKTLEDYQNYIKQLSVHVQDLNAKIKAGGVDDATLAKLNDEKAAYQSLIKEARTYYNDLRKSQTDLNAIYARSKGPQSLSDLKSDKRAAEQKVATLTPNSKENIANIQKASKMIGEMNYKIREQEKLMKSVVMPTKELKSILFNLGNAPLDKLKAAEAELVRQIGSATRGTKEFNQATEQLTKVRQQIASVKDVMKDTGISAREMNKTLANIQTAPMDRLKQAEEKLKMTLKDASMAESTRARRLKELANVQQEISKRETEVANATKKGAQAAKDASIGYKDWQTTVGNAKATMEQLKRAQQELKEKMEKSAPNSKEYKAYAEQLQKVNSRIKEGTDQHTKHASAISQAMSRLKTYVMIYMGFNKLLDVFKNFKQQALGLSDSIADVQKVTKMAGYEVDKLSNAILKLDTRSSAEALHTLSYQAGMLGLKSTGDILGFVKQADQMNWALKELGDQGAVSLMKVATATGDIERYGVDGALRKVGSAINEITANSAASAGPIVEIVSRLSAVGSTAKYSTSELVAIGSTLNALNVKTEMGATAVNRMMMSMQTNISNIASKVGLTSEELRKLKEETDKAFEKGESGMSGSMAVFVKIMEQLHNMTKDSGNPMEVLQPMFKDMGRDGVRLATTLTQIVKNVDVLKDHINITTDAFREGVSMENEYNVKNETFAALVERIGNNIREAFVNSGFTRWMEDMARGILRATEGVGALYRALKLVGIGAIPFAIVYLVKQISAFGTAVKAAAAAGNSWALSFVASKLGIDANTGSVEVNTAAKGKNAAASATGAGAAGAQGAANEGETLTWLGLAGAIDLTTVSLGAFLAIATSLLAVVGGLGVAIYYLCGGFETQTDMQRAMSEATAETTSNMASEIGEATKLFEKLEELVEQEEKDRQAVEAASNALATHGGIMTSATGKTNTLKNAQERLNKTTTERKSLTQQIINKYPQYQSVLNTEFINVNQVKSAYAGLNAELEKKLSLMLQESQMAAAQKSLNETYNKSATSADEDFRDIARHADLDAVQTEKYVAKMQVKLTQLLGSGKDFISVWGDIVKYSNQMLKGMGVNANDVNFMAKNYGEILNKAIKPALAATKEFEAYRQAAKEMEEEVNATPVVADGQFLNGMLALAAGPSQSKSNEEAVKAIEEANGAIIKDLADQDVATLAGWRKELERVANMPFGNSERKARFKALLGYDEPDNVVASNKALSGMGDQIYGVLKEEDFSAAGKFRHHVDPKTPKKKGPKKTKVGNESMLDSEIKDAQIAALGALKGYYEEQQKINDENFLNRLITEETHAMRKKELEALYKFDLYELYKKLLSANPEYKKWFDTASTFDQGKYGHWFDGKDLDKLSKFLYAMGKKPAEDGGSEALTDGMKKNAETAGREARDILIKQMQEMQKILLQYNYTGTIDNNYQKKLEELNLFWMKYQDRMKEGAQRTADLQVREFRRLAEMSLGWTEQDLEKALNKSSLLKDWAEGRDNTIQFAIGIDDNGNEIFSTKYKEDLKALLIMLQDWRHQLIDAQKKVGDEGHKRALEIAETAIETQTHIVKTQEANEALLKSLQSEGYVKSSTVDRYEIEHIKQRIEYQKRLIQLIQLEKGDTKKEFEVLTSLEEKLIEKNEEIQRSIRENVKAYVDVFNEMTSALTTAGNEHASLTALAEIAAKRRLGIAVNTTKTEYMIYSRNGKAVRKMMTEEEKKSLCPQHFRMRKPAKRL